MWTGGEGCTSPTPTPPPPPTTTTTTRRAIPKAKVGVVATDQTRKRGSESERKRELVKGIVRKRESESGKKILSLGKQLRSTQILFLNYCLF